LVFYFVLAQGYALLHKKASKKPNDFKGLGGRTKANQVVAQVGKSVCFQLLSGVGAVSAKCMITLHFIPLASVDESPYQ